MKSSVRLSSIVLSVAVTALSCGSSHDLRKPSGQASFGVEMARANLWREAMFRFQRAVELDPNDALAYNNLAVAYEANGDFDNAAKAYREAMRLDKSNQYIQKNYSRLVEFTSRNKKRQAKAAVAESETATSATTTAEPAATPEPSEPAATPAAPPSQPEPAPRDPATPPPPPVTPPAEPAPASGGAL